MHLSKILLTLILTICATQSAFSQQVKNIAVKNTVIDTKVATTQKLKVVLDKIALVNSDAEFEKNISLEQMNSLIKSYFSSLNLLENTKNVNQIILNIDFNKKDQSFNIQTKTPIATEDAPVYQKVYDSLKSIKKPDVKDDLKIMIYGHTQIN